MKLKKDWSLAYFMFYVCQIGFWLFLFNASIMLLVNSMNFFQDDDTFLISNVQVGLNLSDLELEVEESFGVNIYRSASTTVGLTGSFDKHMNAFFYYNGIQIYKAFVLLLCLFFLAKLFKNVAEEKPFDPDNPKYLYIVGWTLFIASSLNIIIGHLPFPLLEHLYIEGGHEITRVKVMKDYMMEGIFIIVLGYVFKEGSRIHEELKLTV